MIEPYTGKIKLSLKKVHGQLAVIDKMVDNERYCLDIAQQVNAAIGLLKQVNNHILENHLLSCGVHKLESKNSKVREEFARELVKVFDQTKK